MASAQLAYPKVSKLRLAALLCLHGCLIEVLQYFSVYRFGDWQDALADCAGVIVALLAFDIESNLAFMVRPLGDDASSDKERPGAAKNSKLSATTTSEENTN